MKNIITLTTQNVPGVLAKISGVLRRKLFNIESLTVGITSNPEKARFTIIVSEDMRETEKVAVTIEKMIEVLHIKILNPKHTICREIVLAKLKIIDAKDQSILEEIEEDILVKELYKSGHEVCIELIDTSQNLNKFLERILKNNIEVLEWVRSGVIAVEKN